MPVGSEGPRGAANKPPPWDRATLPSPLIPIDRTFEGFLDLEWVELTPASVDKYARKGWVDLRPENFARWKERFEQMHHARKLVRGHGSAAITKETYLTDEISIGDVVAWVFNNEAIGYRIK